MSKKPNKWEGYNPGGDVIILILIFFSFAMFLSILIIQDIGFQPENEVCTQYQCYYGSEHQGHFVHQIEGKQCDKSSYEESSICTGNNCIGYGYIILDKDECLKWRDKTPEERKVSGCEILLKNREQQEGNNDTAKVHSSIDTLYRCFYIRNGCEDGGGGRILTGKLDECNELLLIGRTYADEEYCLDFESEIKEIRACD